MDSLFWLPLAIILFSCANASETCLDAFQRLEERVKISKEISLNTEELRLGENERRLLAVYDDFAIKKFPLLIANTVLEDGFGDYVQLKNILELLRELGFDDVEVLIYYASHHKGKIASHPLPNAKGFKYHFIEFQRTQDHCLLADEQGTRIIPVKEFSKSILSHPLFQEYTNGNRELLVVAAFFSEAFGKLKAANERHAIFLREITPFLKNAILQDLFVLGWGANQAMFVDKKFMLIKSLTKAEKRLLALKLFPERLLKKMCGDDEISDATLHKYFSSHTIHHAYFHQKTSNLAFIEIILHGLSTAIHQHDFYLKNLLPIYQHFTSQGNAFLKTFKISSIEFHFIDGSIKKLTGNSDPLLASRHLRFIETEFLPSSTYALLISLISPPYIEGCTGDNSPQQAILFEHVPLIEHTASKDYPKKEEVEKHYCQNSICLFQALAQIKPYPDTLSKLFYLNDLLMYTIRQNANDKEVPLLTQMIGTILQSTSCKEELHEFYRFATQERNLKPYFRHVMKRQSFLRKHPSILPSLEKEFLEKLEAASPLSINAILMDFTAKLSQLGDEL